MSNASVREPRATTASAWGGFAGLIGSFCCLGPSAAVLLGLGSSSLLFSAQVDQAWAMLASGIVLLCGIIWAVWQARSGAVCGIKRWRQPLVILATFAVAYGSLGLLLPRVAARQEAASAATIAPVDQPPAVAAVGPAPEPKLHRLTLLVEKMNCPPCASKVHNRFRRKPAVVSLRAEAFNEEVIITYDPRQATGEELMKIIPRQYGVTPISDVQLP